MRTGMEWDEWYHLICTDIAKKSQCLSRKIGAILVRDKAIIAQGYNGPPRGVKTCDERWLTDSSMRKKAGFDERKMDESQYVHELELKCPRYVPEMGFKSGEGLEWCVAGHAERNAIINAARMGISTNWATMYMDCGVPCTPCLVEIINSGIREIVVTSFQTYDQSAEYLLLESELNVRMYKHLCQHENQKAKLGLPFSILEGICPDCGDYL
ncbi:MAG: deaminase [Melioribacteraceae bacterium]|nr:deaminase [Melioribacteraceae bacterium]